MIWFLTFGKNGSSGMPVVPATIFMSDKGWLSEGTAVGRWGLAEIDNDQYRLEPLIIAVKQLCVPQMIKMPSKV